MRVGVGVDPLVLMYTFVLSALHPQELIDATHHLYVRPLAAVKVNELVATLSFMVSPLFGEYPPHPLIVSSILMAYRVARVAVFHLRVTLPAATFAGALTVPPGVNPPGTAGN